jgi:hypothetical protein
MRQLRLQRRCVRVCLPLPLRFRGIVIGELACRALRPAFRVLFLSRLLSALRHSDSQTRRRSERLPATVAGTAFPLSFSPLAPESPPAQPSRSGARTALLRQRLSDESVRNLSAVASALLCSLCISSRYVRLALLSRTQLSSARVACARTMTRKRKCYLETRA